MNPKRNDKIIHLEKKLKKEGKKGVRAIGSPKYVGKKNLLHNIHLARDTHP